jgi:endonuclease/exonuclease/phosphatase family metal-dependent hydrolase
MLELTVVTLNTWKCEGHYWRRINLLKEQLLQLNPSIIACQEVFSSASADTAKELAEALNMDFVFVPSRKKYRVFAGDKVMSQSGLALLSKYPIELATSFEMPFDEKDGERKAQCCIIDVQESPILIINTHLSHLKNADALKISQLSSILKHPLLRQSSYEAIILCGDFNSTEKDDTIQYLLNQSEHSIVNCYSEGNGKLPGYTRLMPLNNNESPQGKCIDYIFLVKHQDNLKISVKDASIVLNIPDEAGLYPSDHFGVMVTVALNNTRN